MKTIQVVAAIIKQDDKILATQRGYGDFKGWWEFPGGKIEKGETPEAALIREIKEELNVVIAIDKYITTIDCDYPDFHLHMQCFLCHVEEGTLQLIEAEAARWLSFSEYQSIDWLPADLEVVKGLKGFFE